MSTSRNIVVSTRTLALAAGLVAPAFALGVPIHYDVTHNFTWTPCSQPTQADVLLLAVTDARAKKCKDHDSTSAQTSYSLFPSQWFSVPIASYSSAGQSWAQAQSRAEVSSVSLSNIVTGVLETRGNVDANWKGCWWRFGKRSGDATANSWAGLELHQANQSSCGTLDWAGTWINRSSFAQGAGANKVVSDPITGTVRRSDGTSQTWKFLTIKSTVTGGETEWYRDTAYFLRNTSPDMTFEAVLDVPQGTGPHIVGSYTIVVRNGTIAQASATGYFANRILPTTGSFQIPFPSVNFNYDMSVVPGAFTDVIIGLDGGSNESADPGLDCFAWDNIVTDIGIGANHASISMVPSGDGTFGVPASPATSRVAHNFSTTAPLTYLDTVTVPYFQSGYSAGSSLQAAYVRIWQGDPRFGGSVYAGDLTTDRLFDVDDPAFVNVNRVNAGNPLDNSRQVRKAIIRLDDLGALPPGNYWMEVVLDQVAATPVPQVLTTLARSTDDDIAFDINANSWVPLADAASNRPLDLAFHIICGEPPTCDADFNEDSVVDFFDYLDFVNLFASGTDQADFNFDGTVDFFDYLDFVDAFAAGC